MWIRDDCFPGNELQVQLEQPATLRGTVALEDGTGLASMLRVWNEVRCKYAEAGRSGADGTFEFERLPSGKVTVAIYPDEASPPNWIHSALTPGEVTDLSVVTKKGRVLSGRVLDTDGQPIAGAALGEGWTMRRKFYSDDDGNYRFFGFGINNYGDIHVRAKGFVSTAADQSEIEGEDIFDFAMQPGKTINGRVLDADRKPIASAYVASIMNGATNWVSEYTMADGTFSISGIRKKERPTLFLKMHGYATTVYHLPESPADTVDLGDLQMRKPRAIVGTLMDGDEPITNRELVLTGTNADAGRLAAIPAGWSSIRGYIATRTLRTNAHGQFAFGDLAPGTHRLRQGVCVTGGANAECVIFVLQCRPETQVNP